MRYSSEPPRRPASHSDGVEDQTTCGLLSSPPADGALTGSMCTAAGVGSACQAVGFSSRGGEAAGGEGATDGASTIRAGAGACVGSRGAAGSTLACDSRGTKSGWASCRSTRGEACSSPAGVFAPLARTSPLPVSRDPPRRPPRRPRRRPRRSPRSDGGRSPAGVGAASLGPLLAATGASGGRRGATSRSRSR